MGIRKRLSYANVMATLAFFFALTGASVAGVKYITASDTIPATSDLDGSTYGNPLIAAGKVTSAKIADGAVTSSKFAGTATAPNAARLEGHASADFAQVIARGSSPLLHGTFLGPGECIGVDTEVPGAYADTDFAVAQADISQTNFDVTAQVFEFSPSIVEVEVMVCNPSDLLTIDAEGTYRWIVFR